MQTFMIMIGLKAPHELPALVLYITLHLHSWNVSMAVELVIGRIQAVNRMRFRCEISLNS
jgi:hypothetical protein